LLTSRTSFLKTIAPQTLRQGNTAASGCREARKSGEVEFAIFHHRSLLRATLTAVLIGTSSKNTMCQA
jgi:hypothetical protein